MSASIRLVSAFALPVGFMGFFLAFAVAVSL